ncbi:formate dehydrogenase iron-sulfur subunit [Kytococcus aerolatus]|uniref:Formate dehydrogenase iron-sulfur subunit n=1 Tax=Kytococcus aerolatus TaxID=592308 RepID=A0A212U5Q5_9MICO|nr:4Fe-4S dicluster domain-containing protein [Kytococcus aerolatus]SNC73536.1 formate dehydrogenase iron-sulfur subunit [Kytococcus aerolatus]
MTSLADQFFGPTDPGRDAGWEPTPRKGFFTDTSICIGCKACEVACKEWNALPMDDLGLTGNSYDNSNDLGASTWRHVAFIEQDADRIEQARESGRRLVDLGMPTVGAPEGAGRAPSPATDAPGPFETGPIGPIGQMPSLPATDAPVASGVTGTGAPVPDFRWLMSSDVCKHCTHAGCLDVCPTGALFRSEFGTVVVQADVCNGCGYCVGACPFGVIERRTDESGGHGHPDGGDVPRIGIAQKCTLCYDRIGHDQTPACAQTCPTTSIQFGDHEEMVRRAHERVDVLRTSGFPEARLYGANEDDGVGGTGSVFLLLDEPEVYGLPPDPVVPTKHLPQMYRTAVVAGLGLLGAAAASFLGGGA